MRAMTASGCIRARGRSPRKIPADVAGYRRGSSIANPSFDRTGREPGRELRLQRQKSISVAIADAAGQHGRKHDPPDDAAVVGEREAARVAERVNVAILVKLLVS
jgi:hypothetical protein